MKSIRVTENTTSNALVIGRDQGDALIRFEIEDSQEVASQTVTRMLAYDMAPETARMVATFLMDLASPTEWEVTDRS